MRILIKLPKNGILQMLQVAEYHARAVVSANSLKRPSLKARKQKLLSFLQGMFWFPWCGCEVKRHLRFLRMETLTR